MEQNGSIFMTASQSRWQQSQKLLDRVRLQKRFPQPENRWRKYCFVIAMNPYFDPFIILCICFNAGSMACTHYNMSPGWANFIEACDILFIIIFSLEAFLKIMAVTFKSYWAEGWNKFDFFIVIVSIIGKIGTDIPGVSVARVFRIGRVLRLINKAETLRTMFLTLVYSIPSLWNIGCLLFVIFFVYAVIGMNVFGAIEPDVYNDGIDKHANFQSWENSLLLLYRIGTSDAWGPVYLNCQVQEPDCIKGKTCGSYVTSLLYFVSFGVLGGLVMINLFIAVILDTFTESLESQKKETKLQSVFVWSEIWSQVDTNCDKKLEVGDFIHTIIRAPWPAGLSTYGDTVRVLKATRTISARVMKYKQMRQEINNQIGVDDEGGISANNFPSFPSQEDIKDYLKDLQLLVRKEKYEDQELWIVNYREAVLAIGTKIVGPQLVIHESDVDEDKKPIYDWYKDVFAIDD